jgi:hypothetical protein
VALDFLKNLFRPAADVTQLAAVRAGSLALVGKVKAGPETARSPIKGAPCVAFYYRAYYFVDGRGGQLERSLKSLELHTPLYFLELEGGPVKVVAKPREPFSNLDHRELASRGFQNFRAEEQLVKVGARVRLKGRVWREAGTDGMWVVEPRQIALLGEPERPAEVIKAARRRPGKHGRPAR